ncbi:patatin-like phospholipase family protein [Actinophytocola sp. NPDC049390]|uniref:patatin-like phospholipase family protein n=1 Tax=Actinophytocola sp. NPDC049390 TaxID=3363894 RepID=UPI00379E010B
MTRRALVLGGGGITGIAWEWGILSGLAAAGITLSDADLVVGTSAGSVVGAQVANGLDPAERYAAQLAPPDGEVAGALGVGTMIRYGMAILGGSSTPRKVRQRIGRLALGVRGDEAARVAVIESRLPVREWPSGSALRVTAVDAETGEFRVFDRDSGVPLVRAVAASCAVPGVWPPVTIDGRRYMDGGARSGTNADLAAGYDKVVVLAPIPRGFGPMPGAAAHIERLRRESSAVTLVSPDAEALRAFGRNVLDPAKRADAARAGLRQAASVVSAVRAAWSE